MRNLSLIVGVLLLTSCVQPEKRKEATVERPTHERHFCTREYRPVCAKMAIRCVTTPCEPKEQTFSNRCVMSNNPHATFLHKGVCKK